MVTANLFACRDCGRPSPTRRCAACTARKPTPTRSTTRHTGGARYRKARLKILAADDTCHLCGLPGANTLDHVLPVARGGTNAEENLRPAHSTCNKRKGAR